MSKDNGTNHLGDCLLGRQIAELSRDGCGQHRGFGGAVQMGDTGEIKQAVKSYILEEFLPGEDPRQLTDSTPLITGGILDSLATLKLVSFLEERFHVELQAHEMDTENLNSLSSIASLVGSKL
jgi:acyl carrier protein